MPTSLRLCLALAACALIGFGCAPDPPDATPSPALVPTPSASDAARHETLAAYLDALQQQMDALDALLHPVALLTSREQRALTRFPNREQLQRARALGLTGTDTEQGRATLLAEGRLVRLRDTTDYWIVRELDHSLPLVTPDADALLTRLGERFHAVLAEMGLPPFRLEVSSALRTSDTQADLRRTNPNATRGTSTHEYGTTVDVAYSAFTHPARTDAPTSTLAPALDAQLRAVYHERLAGQRSRELQALVGRVLIDMQNEGLVMVTLEERQPVFHMTVARRLAAR